MKSVGWLMTLVGGSCPGSGVAVNVTAPALGVTAPSSRALILEDTSCDRQVTFTNESTRIYLRQRCS